MCFRVSETGLLEANTMYPSQPVYYSTDNGQEWTRYEEPVQLESEAEVLLECRSVMLYYPKCLYMYMEEGFFLSQLFSQDKHSQDLKSLSFRTPLVLYNIFVFFSTFL